VLYLLVVLSLLVGVGPPLTDGQTRPATEQVRGVLTAMDADFAAVAVLITVRADDGRELRLQVDRHAETTMAFLRDAVDLGWPVVVEYVPEGDGGLAVRVTRG
jgi:hypothetical protein